MNGLTLKLFAIAFAVFFITDLVWLGFIAKDWYLEQYRPWLRLSDEKLNPIWWASVLVYFFFALSVIVFTLPLAQNNIMHALFYGALMGAIIYGVYDFTCLAIFKDFPISMGIADWLWGIVLCAWGSVATCYAARLL